MPSNSFDRPPASPWQAALPDELASGVQTPAAVAPPTLHDVQREFGVPVWLKVMTVLLTLVKGAPLALVALFGGSIAQGGSEWEDFGVVLLVVAAIPLTVLMLQFVAAIASWRVTLLIVSALLVLLDALVVLWTVRAGSVSNGGESLVVMAAMVGLCQLGVMSGAISALKGR